MSPNAGEVSAVAPRSATNTHEDMNTILILRSTLRKFKNLYHDHDNCPDGRLILSHHPKSGTGGKPFCRKCAKMN